MIVAEKVRKSYDRQAALYDRETHLQKHLAGILAKKIEEDRLVFSRILDIGCGTGHLMHIIKNSTVFGCDISFGMLSCAKNKTRKNLYIQSDAMRLPFGNFSFDLVVSNAAYQWVLDLVSAFREVHRILKDNGKFYFTTFNKNTLWQLQSVCKEINIASSSFPDQNKLLSALAEAGFGVDSIETLNYEKYYKDLWELLDVLKNIGSNSAENKNIAGLAWRKILRQANDLYIARFDSAKGISVTYEVFLVKANVLTEGTLSYD